MQDQDLVKWCRMRRATDEADYGAAIGLPKPRPANTVDRVQTAVTAFDTAVDVTALEDGQLIEAVHKMRKQIEEDNAAD